MEKIMLVFSILGFIFTAFWIKDAKDSKDRSYAIFSLVGCIIIFLACSSSLLL